MRFDTDMTILVWSFVLGLILISTGTIFRRETSIPFYLNQQKWKAKILVKNCLQKHTSYF